MQVIAKKSHILGAAHIAIFFNRFCRKSSFPAHLPLFKYVIQ